MPIPGLKVVRSSIHGYGVVATRPFADGEIIAEVDGVLWCDEAPGDDSYCLWMGDGRLLDMVDQTRWINHSCSPNTRIARNPHPDGADRARIVARQGISDGEELTYDYAFPRELAVPCHCKSPSCRGFIIDEDELQRAPLPPVASAIPVAK